MKRRVPFSLNQEMHKFEIRVLSRVFRHTNNNQKLAAEIMSIAKRTLIYHLAEFPEIRWQQRVPTKALGLREQVAQFEFDLVMQELKRSMNNLELAALRLQITVRELNQIIARADYRKQRKTPNGNLYQRVGLYQFDLWQLLDQFEKKLIQEALQQCDGDKQRTSQMLGIGRTTLYGKMKKLGLYFSDL